MLNASEALKREEFILPGRKVITEEITHKLDLNYVHYAEQDKRTMWAESGRREILGRRCKNRGNKGMIYSEWPVPY